MLITKKRIQIIFFILFSLAFFPAFIVPLGGAMYIYVISILGYSVLFLSILLFHDKFIFIKKLFHIKTFRLFCLFISFCIITTIIHNFLGYNKGGLFNKMIAVGNFLTPNILVYFLPIFGLTVFKVKVNSMIKLFYFMLYMVIFIGLIQYFAYIFEFSVLIQAIDFLSNKVSINTVPNLYNCVITKRVYSVETEPSILGQFIFITLPFIYMLNRTGFSIYRNIKLNYMIKKTIFPMAIIVLILTKSPIYLVLVFSEIFVLFLIYNYKKIKKIILPLFLIITFLIILFLIYRLFNIDIDIDKSYLSRIFVALSCIDDFEKLVYFEPSLATRIISYYTQVIIFTKNIFFGVGIGNAEYVASRIFMLLPIPLTSESFIGYFKYTYKVVLNPSVIYTLLAETGLVGFALYVFFVANNIIALSKLKLYTSGFYADFINSLSLSTVAICVISFYNLAINNRMMWLLYGLSLMIIYNFRRKKYDEINS